LLPREARAAARSKKKVKTSQVLLGACLALSVGLNAYLWRQVSHEREEREFFREKGREMEQELITLRRKPKAPPLRADSTAHELARLRNEVSLLRQQSGGASPLEEQLRAQLAQATQDLAAVEAAVAEYGKLTPEEREKSRSILCVRNLKNLGLAARIWADEHERENGREIFPPNILAMTNQLDRPSHLICPSAPISPIPNDWSQLKPSDITYTYLQPGMSVTNYTEEIFQCPIHLHVGLADGSAQMKR
jgi:hypothetical protein